MYKANEVGLLAVQSSLLRQREDDILYHNTMLHIQYINTVCDVTLCLSVLQLSSWMVLSKEEQTRSVNNFHRDKLYCYQFH